jgi:hypothetical protein
MPQVVDKVSANGLNFELYDDGDCVLTNSPTGFVQFSAALIARLARKPGIAAPRKVVISPTTQASPVFKPDAATSAPTAKRAGEPSSVVRRTNIHKLPDAPGWQCTLVDEANRSVTQVYESRTHARAALLGTPIGHAGRIA